MLVKPVVVVTGAGGFIGRALTLFLCQQGYCVRAMVRDAVASDALLDLAKKQLCADNLSVYVTGDLVQFCASSMDITCFKGAQVVVHCAARAHKLSHKEAADVDAFRITNVELTEKLANFAVKAGVKRFVFMSSIGVLGNTSRAPLTEKTPCAAHSPYAAAKMAAEKALVAASGSMDIVIIRPPLVYGPGVKGNFGRLIRLVQKGIPLPFGSVNNRRHFIGIDNLVHFIALCIESKSAANQTFVIADNETLSTRVLLQQLSRNMNKRLMLLPIPPMILTLALSCLKQKKIAEQLMGNLEIDATKAKTLLGFTPPFTSAEQLKKLCHSLGVGNAPL